MDVGAIEGATAEGERGPEAIAPELLATPAPAPRARLPLAKAALVICALAAGVVLVDEARDGAQPPSAGAAAARSAGTALEVYASEHGTYASADQRSLAQIDPQLGADLDLIATQNTYVITVRSPDGSAYSAWRVADGASGVSCVSGCGGGE